MKDLCEEFRDDFSPELFHIYFAKVASSSEGLDGVVGIYDTTRHVTESISRDTINRDLESPSIEEIAEMYGISIQDLFGFSDINEEKKP